MVGGVVVDAQGEIIILNYQNCHKNGARWWGNGGKLLPVDRTCGGNPLSSYWTLLGHFRKQKLKFSRFWIFHTTHHLTDLLIHLTHLKHM